MIPKSLSIAAIAGLAAASPHAKKAAPPYTTGKGFNLVANVTDTTKNIFDPPVNNWFVTGVHVGAGLNAAVLDPGLAAVFFVNGTGQQVSSTSTSVALPPLSGTDAEGQEYYTPQGLQFSAPSSSDEVFIGLNTGLGTTGAGITPGLRSEWADLFGPYGGTFVVCNESAPVYTRPQYPVRLELAEVPDNCVSIRLLAQCADLPDFDGADELNIVNEGVKCYEDVSAIDWSQ